LARRSRVKKITIPGMWFFTKNRTQQEEYKRKNRSPSCQNHTDDPVFSKDHLRSWMCGKCFFSDLS